MTIRLGTLNFRKNFYRKFCNSFGQSYSSVSDIINEKPVGSIKTVKGWVDTVRKMGNFIFFNVNDGSCLEPIQIVVAKKDFKDPLRWGTSISATGKIQNNSSGKLELVAENMKIVGACDITDNFPFIPKQKQSYDLYRQHLHFRPKIKYFSTIMRLRSAISLEIHDYFNKNGFVLVHTPIITSSDCEGAGETFFVRPQSSKLMNAMKKKNVSSENAYFDCPPYLSVSGQLHLEAITRSISKTYTFNPCFRAENSKSRLHLSEFYMVEVEEAFVHDLSDILHRAEDCVKQIIAILLSKYLNDIEYILKYNETNIENHIRVLETLVNNPFSIMTFAEAKSLTMKNQEKFKKSQASNSLDLTKEEELFLVENNNHVPLFVIDWPKKKKPFYMKESNENSDLVKGFDLLVSNVGEVCGGSLREDNYENLKKKMIDMNLLNSMDWYLSLRKFGNVPTGGFGLGFERFLQFILNIQNIKDTIPFPRWPHNLQL